MIHKFYWIASFFFYVHGVKKFPHLPDCFKTTIHGSSKLNAKQSLEFSIEQYHCVVRDGTIGKSEYRSEELMIGFIYDEPSNHSIKYNYTHCSLHELPSKPRPFQEFTLPNITLIDVFHSFQVTINRPHCCSSSMVDDSNCSFRTAPSSPPLHR